MEIPAPIALPLWFSFGPYFKIYIPFFHINVSVVHMTEEGDVKNIA